MIPDLHIPRLFRSNSGATKPMKKSQLAKAKGSLLRYQYVHSTYSKAIEGKRRVVPRAYDRKIELDMPSNRRRTGPTAAERAKKTALSTILVKRNARNRNKRASMKDQRKCKGSSLMWRPNQNKGGGIVGKVLPKSGKMRRALAYSHSDREGHLTSIDIHLLSAAAAANHTATTTADFRGKGTGNESLEMDWGTDSVGDGGREGRRLQQRSARAGRPVIVHPLDKFCETEKSINVTGPEDEGEELLVRCLKSGSKVSHSDLSLSLSLSVTLVVPLPSLSFHCHHCHQ